MREEYMKEGLILKLVLIQNQFRFLHWQTFGDAKHINVQNFLDGITEFLVDMTDQLDSKYDTDLLNLRDEMLAKINQLKYLLTLKS